MSSSKLQVSALRVHLLEQFSLLWTSWLEMGTVLQTLTATADVVLKPSLLQEVKTNLSFPCITKQTNNRYQPGARVNLPVKRHPEQQQVHPFVQCLRKHISLYFKEKVTGQQSGTALSSLQSSCTHHERHGRRQRTNPM